MSHEEVGQAACVVCEAPLEGARCGHCGAAVAPGGYRVLRLISQSVHGRVYLAMNGQGQRVALKELLFALVPGAEQLDAFEREAAVLRSLSHPAIPRFLASFQEGSGVGTRLYLAQEFLEGESLLQRIERQRLGEAEAWTLAEGVLETLQALHQRTPALIHRDVKPANLILRPDGRVALVDFGAARHLARDVTHGSTLVGTFGYMPPEQLGGTVEPSSDLYALGATLVHALTGRMPADLLDEALAVSFEQHVQGSAPLKTFLRRLLAPKRSARFASAAETLTALRVARAHLEAAASPGADAARPAGAAVAPRASAEAMAPRVEAAPRASVDAPVQLEGASEAPVQGTPVAEAPRPAVSKKRALTWALAGLAVAGALLLGLGMVGELLASRSEVVVHEVGTPAGETPRVLVPAQRAPVPTGSGTHRNFRTPWPSESR